MPLTSVVLSSGRSIRLSQVRLTSTYGGMLEGYPNKRINDRIVNGLLQTAVERAYPGTPIHLVSPAVEYRDETAGGFGPIEVLPAVACIGVFESTAIDPEHDPVLYSSTLTIVWFQPTPDVPTGTNPALHNISWDELARDYEL